MSLSWLLGSRGNSDPNPEDLNSQIKTSGDSGQKSDDKVNFDASALERAAKAAKYLESSKHAREAFELSKLEEQTKQQELQKHMRAIDAQKEQLKIDQSRAMGEEKRKTLAEETNQHKQRAQYEDHLARKRHEDELARNAQVQDDLLKKQEASVAKQEAMKRQTMQYESDLKTKSEEKVIHSKYRAKAAVERENMDLRLTKIKAEAEESRQTVLQSLQTVSSVLGQGITTLLSNPDKLGMAACGTGLVALGIYSAKSGTRTLFNIVEKRVSVPSLVRETSRVSVFDFIRSPIRSGAKLVRFRNKEILDNIIFGPELEVKLRDIAIATKFTRKNGGYFRNILFAGPPGTGKTLFAKNLAHHSGLHYAILSGGDITPLGANAVTAIHNVFDWADASNKGTLIFIDEADAFLKKRAIDNNNASNSAAISEHLRSALNAFLYRTGTQSKNMMLVLASNEPEQLDWAASDRVDEVIHFPLPSITERKRLLMMYIQQFILDKMHQKNYSNPLLSFGCKIKNLAFGNCGRLNLDQSIDLKTLVNRLSAKTEGFTGREISKLVVSMQAAALSSEDGVLTDNLIDSCVSSAIFSHSQKRNWLSSYEKNTLGSEIEFSSPAAKLAANSPKIASKTTSQVKNSVKC